MLSKARKEILIKTVTQEIPAYTMSVFKLPNTLYDEMTSMVRTFWWGQTNGRNKMAWLLWDKICIPKKDGGLGFLYLKAFNLALLTKQGWRLQTNTHSLVYHVLKARYFPHSDFLHVELGSKPSFAWQSIMAAQDVVKAGSRWEVGDGSSVQICLDKWLPTHTTFRVTSPPGTLPTDSRAHTLIDDETGEWKTDMIQQLFLPVDADAILGIPKSRNHTRDRIIWAYTPRGIFTVNSAYKRTIWSLSILNKIKSFTWRASRNALPTKVNLCHRGVLEEALCEACGLDEETGGHLFWDCTKARETWTEAGLPIDTQGHVGKELLELIVTIAWCVWYTRNKTQYGTTRQSSREIILKARSILENYQLAQLQKPQHKELADTRWIPPDYPWYKINTDAAVFSTTKSVGIGVMVRDHEGSVLAALSKCMPLPLGPLEAEAKAMDEAVSFTKDIGLQDVIFETDSTTILGALSDTSTALASIDNIKKGTHCSLQDFRRTQIQHIRRHGYRPAHILA
ncbi:hypothetical protein SO802_026135 [Lithocarpus litseifolius]|uniref:Reverse transcriptase n=1 Tax=Lithocarpus litseifolius TaxID=425828 RepID=A0AAW2C269_9ROSI